MISAETGNLTHDSPASPARHSEQIRTERTSNLINLKLPLQLEEVGMWPEILKKSALYERTKIVIVSDRQALWLIECS